MEEEAYKGFSGTRMLGSVIGFYGVMAGSGIFGGKLMSTSCRHLGYFSG